MKQNTATVEGRNFYSIGGEFWTHRKAFIISCIGKMENTYCIFNNVLQKYRERTKILFYFGDGFFEKGDVR